MKCPNCGFDSPPEMRYCGMCGTRLAQACPACGSVNPAQFRYCGACGTRLVAEAAGPVEPSESVLKVAGRAASAIPGTPGLSEPDAPPPGSGGPGLGALEPAGVAEAEGPSPAALGGERGWMETQASPAAIQLTGERRVVTVLVADLTHSTDLLEKVGSEAWVELMNRILHILESEIYRYGGAVDQFRGDGLVAFFGAASAHEDDPERAVLSALAMQQALKRHAGELSERGDLDLRMRVGVNTGEVIIASVGDRRQYSEDTAMGMAVAIAARMEAAAEPGTVLVSAHTYRLVETQFEWLPLGEISVRGMSDPIAVFRPLAPKADGERRRDVQAFQYSIPLIGREAEFHTLKRSVEDLLEGRGRIVLLTGDRGLGKSALVDEVHRYFVRVGALSADGRSGEPPSAASLTWLRGRCRSYGQTWPYSMWLDMLQGWLGFHPAESRDEIRIRLRRQAEALWGDDYIEHYPYLATFLSLPLEENFHERIRHLDGEGLRQRFFLAVRSWVEALAKRGPLVLAFSDVHWADTSSLNLLNYCLPVCDAEDLLWLLVFRPERASPIWEFRHQVETDYPHRLATVELSALTEAHSREFIGWLIGLETLPDETSTLIIKYAEGNPYYIRELIHSLVAEGVLVQEAESGHWRMTRSITTLDMPDSLQRLLLARIGRLSREERHVLQIGAVIGPVFWLNVLQALAGEAHPLQAHLAALQRAQLITESGRVPGLGRQYRFRSPLVRDAAYESLLSAQRGAHHLKTAEYLESLVDPEALGGYYGILAYHYHGAGKPRKELFYTLLAAEQAKQVYAHAEAVERYTRALKLLDEMEAQAPDENRLYTLRTQRFEVLNGRREVFYLMGNMEAARPDARALLSLARQMADDPAWLIDALLAQSGGMDWESREDLAQSLHMAEEALPLAQQLGDQHREMQSLVVIASARSYLRHPTWRETAERALDLARQLGDLRTEVNLLIRLGKVYGIDDLPRSQEYLEAALSRSEKLNDKAIEITLLGALGQQFERRGDYYRQLTEYEKKRLRISREIGNRIVEGQALMFCGQIHGLYLGDDEVGLALEQEALGIWENIPSKLFPLLRMAQIQTAQGKYGEALATLELARPLDGQILDDLGRAGLGLVTAILYNALGDEARLRMVLDITSQVRQMVADNLVSRQYHMAAASQAAAAYLGLARRLAGEAERQAHLGQALQSSRQALDIYQHFGFAQIVECASEEIFFRHSQALAANGGQSEATEYVKRAYDEMMRKFELIPSDSPFRTTYLENIPLHRDIRAAYELGEYDPTLEEN